MFLWGLDGGHTEVIANTKSFCLLIQTAEVSHGCLYSAEVLDSFGDLVAALNKGESIPPKHLITGDFGNTIKRHVCGTYLWLPHTNNQKEQP